MNFEGVSVWFSQRFSQRFVKGFVLACSLILIMEK